MIRVVTRLEDVRHDEKKLKHKMGDFKYKGNGKLRGLVAAEDVKFKAGEIKPIKIKHISIPRDHIGILASYARNKYGHVIAIGEEVPLPIEMNRSADYATFIAAIDGEIKKGDLIGTLILSELKIYR